jgi:phosphoglycolate phosphatase-like HAD superfamily hydrolase
MTVVLFDIDGTLVLTGGAGGRAMARAFEDLFAIGNAFTGVPFAGRPDPCILADAAAAHGIPIDSPEFVRFPDVYLRHLATALDESGPRKGVMPGVRALLDRLALRDDVYLALLTGNYEAAAQLKLDYFDLWRYFSCGAFGDGAADRNSLLPRAMARIAACGGPAVDSREAVVIGDTPLDVACAASGGARCIAVATGGHTVEELEATGADITLPDLADTDRVIELLIPQSAI